MERQKLDVAQLRLFDDIFFSKCIDKHPECAQAIVGYIFRFLKKSVPTILSVDTQAKITSLERHSIRLDALAKDKKGRLINIEIQKANSRALPKRCRYYSSLLDSNVLNKGTSYLRLPETYVIFIMEKDPLKDNCPVYEIERVVKKSGKPFNDKAHIILVNGQHREDDEIGKLINDLTTKNPDKIMDKELAKRVKYYKSTNEGRTEMTGIVDELIAAAKKQARKEAIKEATKKATKKAKLEIAKNLLQKTTFSLEEIGNITGLSPSDLKHYIAKPVRS